MAQRPQNQILPTVPPCGEGIKGKGLLFRLRLRYRFCFDRFRCRLRSICSSIDFEVDRIDDDFKFDRINDDFETDRFNDDFMTTTPTTRRQVGGFFNVFFINPFMGLKRSPKSFPYLPNTYQQIFLQNVCRSCLPKVDRFF